MLFKKVSIIGVGLIGGSLGEVLRREALAEEVIGCGRTEENLKIAVERGLIDSYTLDPGEAVKNADCVVLATPVTYYPSIVRKIRDSLSQGVVLTDVGSVKLRVVSEIEPLLPEWVDFVPAHPVAGTEKSGAKYAFADMFRNRKCVITPCSRSSQKGIEKVKNMWEKAGMIVEIMDPDVHDRVMAYISHLPHMVAYALVDLVGEKEAEGDDLLRFSAGGFRDFTRVASSPQEMWRDICLWNGELIVEAVKEFERHLVKLRELIEKKDADALLQFFLSAREVREKALRENG